MNDKKTVSFGMALAIIFLPILVILLGGLVLRVGFLVPLMLATITASLLSIMAGFTWKEVEACIVNGVHRIIIVTCILFLVGTLIGVWIQAGVIPLFLYWGLKLLSPSMFLVSTVLICAVFSLMTGTSFGTIGTAGLDLLGVGEALGFPTGLTAGAIVSGAYFGDKMSPVSDTTNLASGITGTNIFSHIGSMLYTTVPATLVALGLYWYLGLNYSGGAMPDLTPITDALSANFNRSFLLALPPIVLVALAIRGIPPLPTLVIAILVGVVCAFVIQDGMTVKGMFKAATDGYVSQTGHPLVDKILSADGSVVTDKEISEKPSLCTEAVFQKNNLLRADYPDVICSYAETMFYVAEAYVRGLGVAKDLAQADAAYRKGIEASCVYNGVAAATAASFAAGVPSLSTLGGDDKALEAIASQQRIEMMMRPLEAWSNQRRTGYPALEVPASIRSFYPGIMHRWPYPEREGSVNDNVPHVDGVWTKMWFEN